MLALKTLTPKQKAQFEEEGFLIVRSLIPREEVELLRKTFATIHEQGLRGELPWYKPKGEDAGGDPLQVWPRVMHPHRWNEVAKKYMLDPRVMDILADLFGEEPIAAQSMYYYKPPGARGQALHQDNFYLKASPGTCIASWLAIDRADRENGGLVVVPGSHQMEIVCPEEADPSESFSIHLVRPPKGLKEYPVDLDPGDVLFFNGSMIHGSPPNRSKARFRESFICHYVGISCKKIAQYYLPLYLRDGSTLNIEINREGGPCGEEFPQPKGPH